MFYQKKRGNRRADAVVIAIFLSIAQLLGSGVLPAAAEPASQGRQAPTRSDQIPSGVYPEQSRREGMTAKDRNDSFEGGEVTYARSAEKENSPQLFLIEDAHASLEAQENIALIIKQLKKLHPDARIFVEGTEGTISWEGFWKFPDPASRRLVARYFLEKGRMSGAEFYSAAETQGETLYGLEDRKLHQENIKAYLDQMPLKEKGGAGLKQFQDGLAKLKGLYFTPALREWEREYRLFDNHSENLLRYLQFLSFWAGKEGLPLEDYPRIQKITALGKDPSAAALQTLKTESRSFAIDLFNEKDALEQALFQQTQGPEEMKKTLEAFRQLDLLEALFHLELTHRQWKEFKKEELTSRFESIRSTLIPFAGRLKIDLSRAPDLLGSLEASQRFYEKAVEREAVMINVLEKGGQASGVSTAIVIAGGFHSEGIRDHFRSAYGLTQISPAIRDIHRSVPYWEIFEGKRTPLEAWFSGAELLSGKPSRGAYLMAKESADRDPDFNASALALLVAASDLGVRTGITLKGLRETLGTQFPDRIHNLWSDKEGVVVTRPSGESAVLRVQKNTQSGLIAELQLLEGRLTAPAVTDISGRSLGNFSEIIVMTPDPKRSPFIYDPGELLEIPTHYLGSLHEVEFALEENARLSASGDRPIVAIDLAWAEDLPIDDIIRDWKTRFPKAFFTVMTYRDTPLSPAAQKARAAADGTLTTHILPAELAEELIGLQQKAFGASLGFDGVIIAEDELGIRALYEDLVDMGGLLVRGSFGDGVDALEFIRQFKVQHPNERLLLITDLNMPNMEGDELAEKVREEFPDVFIVLNTAAGDIRKLKELKNAQGQPSIDVVLQKPVELAQFDFKGWAQKAREKIDGKSLGERPLDKLDKDYPYEILIIGPYVDKLGEDLVLFRILVGRLAATFPKARFRISMDHPEIFELDESLKDRITIVGNMSKDSSGKDARTPRRQGDGSIIRLIEEESFDILVDLVASTQDGDSMFDWSVRERFRGKRSPYIISGLRVTGVQGAGVVKLVFYDETGKMTPLQSIKTNNVYDNLEEGADLFGLAKAPSYKLELSEKSLALAEEFIKTKLNQKGVKYDPGKPVILLNFFAIESFTDTQSFMEEWKKLAARLAKVEDAYIVVSQGDKTATRELAKYDVTHLKFFNLVTDLDRASKNVVLLDRVDPEDHAQQQETSRKFVGMVGISDIVITPDTGTLHLAKFLEKPVILIAEPTKKAWFPPDLYAQRSRGLVSTRDRNAYFDLLDIFGDFIRFVEREQFARQSEFYRRLGEAVVESHTTKNFARTITDTLKEMMDFDRVEIFIVDPIRNTIRSPLTAGAALEKDVLGLREPYYASNGAKTQNPIPGYEPGVFQKMGIEDLYLVPLIGKGEEPIAFLSFMTKQGKVTPEKDRLFLKNIAHSIAGGILRIQSEERLAESEEQFRALFEDSPTGLHVLNPSGFIMRVNARETEMLGYKPEEMIGQKFTNFVAPEERENAWARFEARVAGTELPAREGDRHYVRKDGKRIIVATKDRVQRDESGKAIQVQTSLIDITEQREKESLLDGLSRLMNEMNKRGNIDDVYRVIVEEGTRLLGFDRAGLNLWTQAYDSISGKKELIARVDYQYHVNPSTAPPEDPRGKIVRVTGLGLTAETLRERKPILVDYRKEPDKLTDKGRQAGITYSISLPIQSQDRVIGNIIFSTADPNFSLKEGSVPILERLVGYLSVAIQTKKDAEKLKGAQDFLKKTVEHIPAMLFIKRADDLTFVYHNKKFEEFMGLAPRATVGTSDYDYFPKQQADFFRVKDLEVLQGGKEVDVPEERISTPNGIRILHTIKVPIMGPDGKPQYLLGISEDITERKMAEQELAQSRLRLQTILDAAPFAILMRGADLRLEYTNEKGEKLFKAMTEQKKKSGMIPAIFEGSASLKSRYIFENDTVLKSGASINQEEAVSVDGKERHYHVIKESLKGPDGTVFGLLEIYEDVTEARANLERAKNAEKWESTTLMAGQIAHDFNNLLVSPLAQPDLIRSRLQVGEPVEENLTHIQNSAIAMQEIARELLTLSKIGKAQFEPMDLTLVVKQISGMYQSSFPGVRFDAAGLDAPHYIKGNVGQLGQVVSNLVVNAGDAMAEKGGILILKMEEVSLRDPSEIQQIAKEFKPGTYVKLTVKDTGSGIPADVLSRIFDPFFSTKQLDARRGSGLGLSTVKGVLESHGGYIDVRTSVGEGTEFYGYLPVSDERPKSAVVKAAAITKGPGLIWVIDDEPSVKEIAAEILKDDGYQVVEFASGVLAAQAAESGEVVMPDLVLSDMRMDGDERAGVEGFIRIKKAFKVEQLKGIMMSGNVTDRTKEEARKAGFSEFLGKPFRMEELSSIVMTVLAVQAPPGSAKKEGVETLLIVEDDELIGDIVETFSKRWRPMLKVVWAKSAQEAIAQLKANAPFDVIYLDQNLPDGTGSQVYQELISSNKKNAFTKVIFASGSGGDEAPFEADASLPKPFKSEEFLQTLIRFDSEIRGPNTGVSMTPVRPAGVDRLSGQSLGTKIEADPLLRDYFQTAMGDQDMRALFSQAAAHKGPLALVFTWDALQSGSLAEELALLFSLMPELKIYVATDKPFETVNAELATFDPRGLLTQYREWGSKPQLILLPGHSVQEAKKESESFVGKGPQGESVTGVFVMEGSEDAIRFLGTSALYRFVAVQKTRFEKDGRLLALPTMGIQAMLGSKDLPGNIQKNTDGTFRVFAFDLAEISAQLTKELLARTALAKAA